MNSLTNKQMTSLESKEKKITRMLLVIQFAMIAALFAAVISATWENYQVSG